jgi:asparagine synthase (glutamine-hydrolysing)
MCGVLGVLGLERHTAEQAAGRMRVALRHRGPNDEGLELVAHASARAPVIFGHTRLSIVELSAAGHQPMWERKDGAGARPNVVTFNGEIYNFRELSEELGRAGFPSRSRSDTEVILNAYRAWGVRAVERFEGMFAFALFDAARDRVWLCRDRLGIKPLYLFRPRGGGLLFASEMRALLAAGPDLVPRRVRAAAIESFLAQGAVMGDSALVDGVTMLPPGTSLVCDVEGRVERSVRYWSVAFGSDTGSRTKPADGAAESAPFATPAPALYRSELVLEIGLALRRAMKQLVLADVPVGLFLSGGVDSGVLATVATEATNVRLRTLTVGFDVPGFDEILEARATARELGTDHAEVVLTGESVLASFDEVLDATDQPTVDGFNTFHVSRAARRAGLTVALSGLGGDELFGGYASFRDVPRALRLSRLLSLLGSGARGRLSRALRLGRAAGVDPRMLAKLGELVRRPPDLVGLYLLRRELFSRDDRRALLPLSSGSDPLSGLELPALEELSHWADGTDAVDAIAGLELGGYMRHMLLRDSDVFSMRHALELRVPLLEPYVVEHAARARSAWRKPDPRPKPLLVDAAGPRLPERAWRAKKRGFTFPWAAWLRGPLRARATASLAGGRLADIGLDPGAARAIWQRFERGDDATSPLQIIALMVLESLVARDGLTLG